MNLERISKERLLGFSTDEMKKIREFFTQKNRAPTIAEIEMIAQAWSEHTRHKTLTGEFRIHDLGFRVRKFKNLLKETVFAATKELNRPWVLSAFKDNAGIVAFDKNWAIAIKVETHNHPSALMPYGGASTGLGGVIRDILGAGLGAYPIAGIDVFCVSPHEPRLLDGLVAGVRDYGNRMGIPTTSGAIFYDEIYRALPLVFCGCVGVLKRSRVKKRGPFTGDLAFIIGNKTGRDGIHGATFSSQAHSRETPTSVVQIGNPILEKKLLDFLTLAGDLNLYNGITDLGAGGIACALWEMADSEQPLGIKASLDGVPLKEKAMEGWAILVSESQERMMVSVPPSKKKQLESLLRQFELDFSCLGQFDSSAILKILHRKKVLVNLPIKFLKEVPKKNYELRITNYEYAENSTLDIRHSTLDIHAFGLQLLSSPNIASKANVIRQYDHEVGGRTVIKPFVGNRGLSPSDASVLKPLANSFKGIAIGLGWSGSAIKDPRAATLDAFDEALRNVVSVGGHLEHLSVLDNYCAGNAEDEKVLAELVLVSEALRDASLAFGVPFVSGKDSLNNASSRGQDIPTVILVTALGVLRDIRKCVTPVLKKSGNLIYLVGKPFGENPLAAPIVDLELAPKIVSQVSAIVSEGLVQSCHDLSDGGLFVALAETMLDSIFGMRVDLDAEILFCESPSRFLLEVSPQQARQIEIALKGLPFAQIGFVQNRKQLDVTLTNKSKICWKQQELLQAYQGNSKVKKKEWHGKGSCP